MAISKAILELPKVELHCHLEACFRHRSLLEIGHRVGLYVPDDPEIFRRDWLVAEPKENLVEMISGFDRVRELWFDSLAIRRLTREAIEDAYQQNVRVLELRYSPDFIQNGKSSPGFDEIHGAILDGISDAKKSCVIAVGLIGIIRRNLPGPDAKRIADFIIANSDTFVGIDLADQELNYPGRNFKSLFEQAKNAGLGLTMHAGEVNCDESRQNVRDAIQLIQVDRIGHGLHIASDETLTELVIEHAIPLELCPSSNVLTGSIKSIDEHPFPDLYKRGVRTTINTDDPSLFAIDWNVEHQIALDHFDLSTLDVQRCVEMARAASFIDKQELDRVWPE